MKSKKWVENRIGDAMVDFPERFNAIEIYLMLQEYTDQQTASLRQENERLKGLIKELHDRHLITKTDREMTWLAFCKHHNL